MIEPFVNIKTINPLTWEGERLKEVFIMTRARSKERPTGTLVLENDSVEDQVALIRDGFDLENCGGKTMRLTDLHLVFKTINIECRRKR